MDEQTSLDMGSNVGMFDDVTAEDIAEMSGEATPSEPQESDSQGNEGANEATEEKAVAPEEKAVTPEEKYVLKVMGKDVELSRDELIRMGQKGMDYDRVRQPYDKLNALAQTAGQSVDDFLSTLESSARDIQLNRRINELMSGGEFSENAARQMAKMEMQLKGYDRQREQMQAQAQAQSEARRAVGEFVRNNPEFMKEFPNGQLPDSMVSAINGGATIGEAWARYQLGKQADSMRSLQDELNQLKQAQSNKQAAAPAVKGDKNPDPDEFDPFLIGLNSSNW